MENDREKLKTGHAEKAQNRHSRSAEGRPKVYAFPSQSDRQTEMARETAKRLGIPFVDPLRAEIEPSAVALLKPETALSRQVLPIRLVDNILLVAMASPDQPIGIRSLELLTGCKIRPAAAPTPSLVAALQEIYGSPGRQARHSRQQNLTVHPVEVLQEGEIKVLTISIISNKGGVGKTHLSINLAYALGKTGARVLLVDADLGNADISNKLGIFPEYHLLDFLEKEQEMKDLVVGTQFNFDLIASASGEFKLANLNYAQKMKFVKHFQRTSKNYDFAIFDLGAGIARTVLDFALAADRTVIVTTPQDVISGYACAKAAFSRFKEIEERLEVRFPGYAPQMIFSPMLVINQVSHLQEGFNLYNTIDRTADRKINADEGRFRIKPEYLGAILYDKDSLRTTEARKKPLLVHLPYVKASQCIRHLSEKFHDYGGTYDPRVKFRHRFRRFVAVLSQKI